MLERFESPHLLSPILGESSLPPIPNFSIYRGFEFPHLPFLPLGVRVHPLLSPERDFFSLTKFSRSNSSSTPRFSDCQVLFLISALFFCKTIIFTRYFFFITFYLRYTISFSVYTARLDIGKRFKRTNITQTVPNVSSYISWMPEKYWTNYCKAHFLWLNV